MVEEAEAVQHPAALTEPQITAAVFRGAMRLLSGGAPDPVDDLEVRLLAALEVKMLAARAEQYGMPRVARVLERCAPVPPVAMICITRMVNKLVAASPIPEPGPVVYAKGRAK